MPAKTVPALMLIVLTLASSAEKQEYNKPKPLPKDREVDTYAVYDAALQSTIWGQPHQNTKYYIRDRAVKPNSGWQPEKCLHPPDELREKLNEMLQDLAAQPTYRLEPRFKLDKPYEMIDSDRHDGFPPGTETIQLGVVSFSKDRSLASVVVWGCCGSQWKVFTRGKKGWEEQTWSLCGAVS
jgi:hypothetical protein